MTSAVWLRKLSDFWLLALAVVGCATASGQRPAPPAIAEVHIGLQIRQLDGTPINYLKAKNFKVSVSGRSLPVRVRRPSLKRATAGKVQTRLLLILPSPPAPGGPDVLAEAIDKLTPVWREGWQVAVRAPQGGLTPYVSSEKELQQALREFTFAHSTDQAAIDTLKGFAGRRLVMTAGNGALGQAASGVQAMLYDVGGNPDNNYSYGDGVRGSTGSLPSYGDHVDGTSAGPAAGGMHVVNNTETYTAQVDFFVEDVRAERSFGTAVRDARSDARSYYDLVLQIDPGVSRIAVGISIEPPYRVLAQAYTPISGPPPEVVLIQERR
jgi:hypothetical protein